MTDVLKNNKLFENIAQEEIVKVLKCLSARKKSFKKGQFIFLAGQSAPAVGILLSGEAQVIKENMLGDSMIIGSPEAGEMFGETFACMGLETMPVSVTASEKCQVLFLDIGCLVNTCRNSCDFHRRLISNLLKIMASKNAFLNRKMSYITHKTIRSRLTAYFYDLMEMSRSYDFSVPYNRNELADFLCVDRSAMCRELSNMKADGIIAYSGRRFRWLKNS